MRYVRRTSSTRWAVVGEHAFVSAGAAAILPGVADPAAAAPSTAIAPPPSAPSAATVTTAAATVTTAAEAHVF